MKAMAVPAVVLVPEDGPVPVGGSHLLGAPHVPDGFEWPTWSFSSDHSLSGRTGTARLRFIAQINLRELARPVGGFDQGHLLFFYDDENCLSLDPVRDRDGHRVVHIPEGVPLHVAGTDQGARVRFVPGDGDLVPESARHWMGGSARPVQGDPCAEAQHLLGEPEQRALLLQVDTDPTLNVMWGDTGAIYFTIPRSDLADGTLDRTWLTYQSA